MSSSSFISFPTSTSHASHIFLPFLLPPFLLPPFLLPSLPSSSLPSSSLPSSSLPSSSLLLLPSFFLPSFFLPSFFLPPPSVPLLNVLFLTHIRRFYVISCRSRECCNHWSTENSVVKLAARMTSFKWLLYNTVNSDLLSHSAVRVCRCIQRYSVIYRSLESYKFIQ